MTSGSGFTPFTQPEIVTAYLQPMLERLALTFSSACERTYETFVDRGWSGDAALAAYLIRKEVLENLRIDGLQVEEEDVEVERKALCGLLLTLPLVHLKIRKSKDGEIPAAGSRQSLSFYNWNLLVFPQAASEQAVPLHLLLLWNDNRKGRLESMHLVCVEGNDWRWRIPVFQRAASAIHENFEPNLEVASRDEESFATAFDSANEDVPLKLAKDETLSPVADTAQDSEQQDNENEQPGLKKKA